MLSYFSSAADAEESRARRTPRTSKKVGRLPPARMPLSAGVFHCTGVDGKCNWLLVRPIEGAERTVVFFPGDISDFGKGGNPYHPYSLESLLWVLCIKFPNDTIVVVKPRMMNGFHAIYVNFLIVDEVGNPRPLEELRKKEPAGELEGDAAEGSAAAGGEAVGDEMEGPQELALDLPRAAAHLAALLRSAGEELGAELPTTLVLVGFSKGAAVLNALLRDAEELVGRCTDVHYVDAGLHIPGVFPMGARELELVARAASERFTVWLHGTPRQMDDPQRPFVAQESREFEQRCRDAGLRVERRSYAEGGPPSLDMHFDALRSFQTCAEDRDFGPRYIGFFSAWARTGAIRETG